jgi:phage baseplate assembly protein W
MSLDQPDFLGRGWSFPPSFTPGGAAVRLSSGSGDIAESLQILLQTVQGERVMRPGFGAGLETAMFAEVDQNLLNAIAASVSDAILDEEPRVRLDEVDVSQSEADPGMLRVTVAYTVLANNSRFNLVYPFSLTEASESDGASG